MIDSNWRRLTVTTEVLEETQIAGSYEYEYDNDFSALEICNLNYDKLSHDFSVEAYNCSRLRSNDVMAFSRSLEHYAAQKQEMSDSQGKNCLSGWKMQCYFSFENLLMSLYHQYPFLQ